MSVLVGLSNIYARTNKIDKASHCLAQIDSILPAGVSPAAELVPELQEARELVRKADSRSSLTGTDGSGAPNDAH